MKALLLLACAAWAEPGLPRPAPAPPEIPRAERAALEKRRARLDKDAERLAGEIAEQRLSCGRVDTEDAAETKRCREWGERLSARYAAYATTLAEHAKALTEARAAARRARALRCAAAEVLSDAESLGRDGRRLAREVRKDLERALDALRAAPASGRAGVDAVFAGGGQHAAKDRSEERALVVTVVIRRDEATGVVTVDVQSSLSRSGVPERAVQNVLTLDALGNLGARELTETATACLAGKP